MKRFKILKTGRKDYPINVQVWNLCDENKKYYYAGFGRFCKNKEEVNNFIESEESEVK